jgi:hypothetical protein
VLSAFLAAFGGFLKREGQLFALFLLGAILVLSWKRRDWVSPLVYFSVVAVLLIPHFLYLHALPASESMTVPPAPDEDYFGLIATKGFKEMIRNVPSALAGFLTVPFTKGWGGAGILFLVCLLAFLVKRFRRSHSASVQEGPVLPLLVYSLAMPLLMDVLALSLRPYGTVEWLMDTASSRLWIQVVGPFFMLMAYLFHKGFAPVLPSNER